MKHLRKYNESKEEFNTKYFNDCFIEFIDSGSWSEIGDDYGDGRKYYEISMNLPGVQYKNGQWILNKEDTLLGNLKYAEELLEFYKEIENCIEKVKIKYPNIEIEFNIEKESNTKNDIVGSYIELFDAYVMLILIEAKSTINKPMKKGLNIINFSELDNTWDVRPEN
jgi:hypothetical protein